MRKVNPARVFPQGSVSRLRLTVQHHFHRGVADRQVCNDLKDQVPGLYGADRLACRRADRQEDELKGDGDQA